MLLWTALRLILGLITLGVGVYPQAILSPVGDVQVCPNSQDVVVITCNESRSSLQWRIETLISADSVFVSDEDPLGIPRNFMEVGGGSPGINVTVLSASSTSVSSSVTVDTSQYNLTGSRIKVLCGSIFPLPFASIQLWGIIHCKNE